MNHAAARRVIEAAWPSGVQKTLGAVQLMQALGCHESSYGRGWKAPCSGSNNWGAVQVRAAPPCPPGSCKYTDTHADGSRYSWCYKTYPTPEAGAAHMMQIATRTAEERRAVATGSALQLARAMHAAGYYEGNGATPEARIRGYANALYSNVKVIAAALGERVVSPDPATDPESQGGRSPFGTVLTVTGAMVATYYSVRYWKRRHG